MSTDERAVPRVPRLDGETWRVCTMPDLGDLAGPDPARQHIVDHGFVRATNGKWQLWACIRGTAVSRLIYGWEGDDLERGPWEPRGVKVRARAEFGEGAGERETAGAPFFFRAGELYYCLFHSRGLHALTSRDGVHYERRIGPDGTSCFLDQGGRDVMVLRIGDRWFLYLCVTTVSGDGWKQCFDIVRTSPDLEHWSDYTICAAGGVAGDGPVSAESPFVVELDGYFYMFRATSTDFQTYVYRSRDPYNFGVHDDSKLVTKLPLKAPEVVRHDGRWFISDLADWQGIMLSGLCWDEA